MGWRWSGVAVPGPFQYSSSEVTSALPDDSRDADERDAARALRDLRGRVKAARAVIASTPGLAETLASDPRRAAMFYARFGVTEEGVRKGVAAECGLVARASNGTPGSGGSFELAAHPTCERSSPPVSYDEPVKFVQQSTQGPGCRQFEGGLNHSAGQAHHL